MTTAPSAAAMPDDDASTRARIVGEICGRLVSGESVDAIFRAPGEDYPSERTFWRWLFADPELDALYEKACVRRAEVQAQQTEKIADEAPQYVNTQFGKHVDAGFEQWRRTRIDTRKWHAASMRPKRWGQRTVIAGDPDNPLEHRHITAAIESKLLPEFAGDDPPATPGKPDGK